MSSNIFRKGPHASKNKVMDEVLDNSAVDERKTVVLDEDLENVGFDDKVWLYWQRNRNFILATIALAVAMVVCIQGWKMYVSYSSSALASAYEAASENGTLADFAKLNASTKLGATALLQNADKLFSQKKFAEAKLLYANSSDALKDTVLFGRAKLGEAFCAYELDNTQGKKALEALAANNDADNAFRAQAAYALAQADLSSGNTKSAKKRFEDVAKNPRNGIFARLAAQELSRLN